MKISEETAIFIVIGAALLFTGGVVGYKVLTQYSVPDLLQLAGSVGFTGADLVKAVAVAVAESSGDPNAKGDINIPGPGDASYGLWQVNSHWHPEYGPNFEQLYDPQTNANAAYQIYRAAHYSFSPWSTFKSGAYLAFIPEVEQHLLSA